MVKWYHGSFLRFSYEFDSRYPLHYLYSDLQSKTARPNFGRAVSPFAGWVTPIRHCQIHHASFALALFLSRYGAKDQ